MEVISAREFRSHQGKYFDMVKKGIDVIVKSRGRGSFKITPVTEDDTLMSKEEFWAKVDRGIKQIENGEGTTFETFEDFKKYADSL